MGFLHNATSTPDPPPKHGIPTHTCAPASGIAVIPKRTLPDLLRVCRCLGHAVLPLSGSTPLPETRVLVRIDDADDNANAERPMSELGKVPGIVV